jgi:predicted HicB family RNase H-like nuclease
MSTKNQKLHEQRQKGHRDLKYIVQKDKGRKKPRKTIQVRMSKKSHSLLKKVALRNKMTLSKMVDEVISYYKRNNI